MNVLMIDELPIYIHGMKTELKRVMPECTVFLQTASKMHTPF
jgi:hypothetical protein